MQEQRERYKHYRYRDIEALVFPSYRPVCYGYVWRGVNGRPVFTTRGHTLDPWLAKIYSDETVLLEDIERLRKDRDPRVRLDIVKLALSYLYGKPMQSGEEDAPPMRIDISAIPRNREPIN